jgi:hypothetical protein
VDRLLNEHLTLNDHYLVSISTNLANDLVILRFNKNHKLITHNIKDLCVNIPIEETLDIIKSLLILKNDLQITDQILSLMKLVLSQNYFIFLNKIYQPERGVAMGSPVSSTTAKIFLQYFEDKPIKHILNTKNVMLYICCVNGIVSVCDSKKIHSDLITTSVNQIHKYIKLNPTHEDNGQIYFLDLLLIQKPPKTEINIFQKPPAQTQLSISSQTTLQNVSLECTHFHSHVKGNIKNGP